MKIKRLKIRNRVGSVFLAEMWAINDTSFQLWINKSIRS